MRHKFKEVTLITGEKTKFCVKCQRFHNVICGEPCTTKKVPKYNHLFFEPQPYKSKNLKWYKCAKCGINFTEHFIDKNKHILKCHMSDDEYTVKDIIE